MLIIKVNGQAITLWLSGCAAEHSPLSQLLDLDPAAITSVGTGVFRSAANQWELSKGRISKGFGGCWKKIYKFEPLSLQVSSFKFRGIEGQILLYSRRCHLLSAFEAHFLMIFVLPCHQKDWTEQLKPMNGRQFQVKAGVAKEEGKLPNLHVADESPQALRQVFKFSVETCRHASINFGVGMVGKSRSKLCLNGQVSAQTPWTKWWECEFVTCISSRCWRRADTFHVCRFHVQFTLANWQHALNGGTRIRSSSDRPLINRPSRSAGCRCVNLSQPDITCHRCLSIPRGSTSLFFQIAVNSKMVRQGACWQWPWHGWNMDDWFCQVVSDRRSAAVSLQRIPTVFCLAMSPTLGASWAENTHSHLA